MSRSADPRESYHHGDLRAALLDAAGRLVERNGATHVSLRAIAREAGVSPAAPYHHFPDRESLLAGVAIDGFEALARAMRTGAEGCSDETALGRLQAAGVAYVCFAVENPEIYRLMFSGLLSDRDRFPGLREAADGTFGVLIGLLGTEDRTEVAADAATWVPLTTWSTVHGLALLLIEGIEHAAGAALTPGEITRQVTTVLGQGLKSFQP
jgi:AcrR family transcriptional regulator